MSLVLVVDDEPGVGRLVEFCLAGLPVEVATIASVGEATALAEARTPRVVLLDVALDNEDGLTLIPRFRTHPALADVPIVVLSVHDSREAEARELGATDFVRKPFGTEALRSRLLPYLEDQGG